jgi:hypothetical protein
VTGENVRAIIGTIEQWDLWLRLLAHLYDGWSDLSGAANGRPVTVSRTAPARQAMFD